MNKIAKIRNSKEYKRAKRLHLRHNSKCVVCGITKGIQVHHLNCLRYFPEQATDPSNLVTLCGYRGNNCHSLFHNKFIGSYRKKCTKDDFVRFMKIVNHMRKIGSQQK